MRLVAFRENDPYSVDEFPFDDMYETNRKFIKVGLEGDLWLGILITDEPIEGEVAIDRLSGFTSLQRHQPVTKSEVIAHVYTPDQEAKIVRDWACNRNRDRFYEYDQFVQSIPSQ